MAALSILLSVLVLILITRWYQDKVYRFMASLAFAGHLFVVFVFIPTIPYTWDIEVFHRSAISVLSGQFPSESATVASFGAVEGLLYTFLPSNPETISVFNSLLAVLVFIPIRYLCKKLYPDSTSNHYGVMALVLFLPLPFFFLSIPMRDSLSVVWFFGLLALAIRALLTRQGLLAVSIVPAWGMLFMLRPELALVLVLGLLTASITEGFRSAGTGISAPKLVLPLALIGAIGFSLFAELLYPFEAVNAEVAHRASGGAVYLDGMRYTSWFDFLLAVPGRAIYFQFSPFPLHVESGFHLLAFSTMPIIIILFVSAARSLYMSETHETIAVLLVVVYLAGIAGYGAINSNFGTNVRHRIVFEFLLIVMAAPVIHRWELGILKWVGVVPRQRSQYDEHEREA
jgi:hypothetical protein